MRNNRQLRTLGAALVALIVIFVLMTVTAQVRTEVTVVEKALSTVLYPLQVATDWAAGKVQGVTEGFQELIHLREENAQLREEVQEADQLAARNELLERENEELRRELELKDRSEYPLMTAEIIGRSPDTWYQTITINRGSRDGVEPNMAVVNWQGLVGKVTSTTPFTAQVQLLVDAGYGQGGFGAGAKLPSGELGVIEASQGGFVRMKFFSSNPAVTVGQPVFTSGQGVIPPNLLIGYVDSLGDGSSTLNQYVNIRPAVDFNKLNVVDVVMYTTTTSEEEEATP